jgi:hypothetical protein
LGVGERSSDKITLTTDDDSSKIQVDSTTNVTDDAWHWVVGARVGDAIAIAIDGQVQGSAGLPAGYDLSGASQREVLLGAIWHHGNNVIQKHYTGMLDDVRIYDYALTEDEMKSLYRVVAGLGDLKLPDHYGPMLAHYEFEGDANDSSGNERHGVLQGDADASTGVLMLDGDGDYVVVGSVGLGTGDAPRTIAGWVKASSLDIATWTNIFGFTSTPGGGTNLSFDFTRMPDGTYGAHVYGWESPATPIDLEYHHLAATYDGANIKWYADGRHIGTVARGLSTQDHVQMGKRGHDAGGFFPGEMDDIRIYETALTYGQIVTLAVADPYLLSDEYHDTGRAETAIDLETVHGGKQAMSFRYDNRSGSSYHAKTTRHWDIPQLWTKGGAKALSIRFHGDPSNAVDDEKYLYLDVQIFEPNESITRTRKVVYPDSFDLEKPEWQEWRIDMRDFHVDDFSEIVKLDIGIRGRGQRTNTGGILYIDDIRAYAPECIPALGGPISDMTGDCLTDGADLRIMVGDWLEHDYTISPTPPNPAGLLLHWTFDSNTGGIATDSSGNGNDGVINGATLVPGMVGNCLDFEAGAHVIDVNGDAYMNGLSALSISLWVQSDVIDTDKGIIIFEDPQGRDDRNIRYDSAGASAGKDDVIKYGVGSGGDKEQDESSEKVQTTEWQHLVLTWTSGAGMTLYIDGQLDTPSFDDWARSGTTDGYIHTMVGKGGKDGAADAGWDGRIDDVRIYDYALSHGEVLHLAGADEIYVPLVSPANLYDAEPINSKFVNFKDYAILADEWMLEILWPSW